MTLETGLSQIPAILRGERDVPSDSELGSKDYGRGVGAVILGAGYENEDIQRLRDAAGPLSTVPWLRPDTTKPAPPLGPEYGKALVERIKQTVVELQESGKMGEDALVWY